MGDENGISIINIPACRNRPLSGPRVRISVTCSTPVSIGNFSRKLTWRTWKSVIMIRTRISILPWPRKERPWTQTSMCIHIQTNIPDVSRCVDVAVPQYKTSVMIALFYTEIIHESNCARTIFRAYQTSISLWSNSASE